MAVAGITLNLLVLSLSLLATTTVALHGPCLDPVVLDVDTGADDGVGLPNGATDPDWVLTSGPGGAASSVVHKAHTGYIDAPPAKWLSSSTSGGHGAGFYHFENTFTLPASATAITLALETAADNEVDIYLNGILVGSVVGTTSKTFTTLTPMSTSIGFIPGGTNVIEAVVDNHSSIMGFVLRGDVTYCAEKACNSIDSGVVADAFDVSVSVRGNPFVVNHVEAGPGSSGAWTVESGGGYLAAPPVTFSADALHSQAEATSTYSHALAYVEDLHLDAGGGALTIRAESLRAEAFADASGVHAGETRFGDLEINGVYVPLTTTPNVVVPVAPGTYVVLNEQIRDSGGITVNLVRAVVELGGGSTLDIIVSHASARCDELADGSCAPPVDLARDSLALAPCTGTCLDVSADACRPDLRVPAVPVRVRLG